MDVSNKNDYLTFTLGGETLALPTSNVLEVIRKQKIQRVPTAPKFVKGILNFRGDIVTVYDSREKFGITINKDEETYVVMIVDLEVEEIKETIGVIVDSVNDVVSIASIQIKPVPQMQSKFSPEFLEGVVNIDDNFILILNTEKTFAEELIDD